MRWHVHGTDATTGQDIVLALDQPEATQAVQAAIAKRILVSHVTKDAGESVRRMLLPIMSAAVVVLIPLCIAVYAQNLSIRAKFDQAVAEQTRLAQSVAQAETLASQIRASSTMPSTTSEQTALKVRELAEQLASARQRMSLTEQQLSNAHDQMNSLEQAATQVPSLESQLATMTKALSDSENRLSRLTAESAMQTRRLTELASLPDSSTAKNRALVRANRELSDQVDLLKTQLLSMAARPVAPAAEPEAAPPVAPSRWAIRAGYAAASDFLSLQFDKDTIAAAPASDGAVTTSGALAASAATFHFTHDPAKERLYSATLTISLAADAPRERLAANMSLAALFIKTLAPSLKQPESALAAAIAELAGKDPSQRLVLLGDDYKLSIWNNRLGTLSLKMESPRADAED